MPVKRMKFASASVTLDSLDTDLLVIPVTEREILASTQSGKTGRTDKTSKSGIGFTQINSLFGGDISASMKRANFKGAPGKTFLANWTPKKNIRAILFYGFGGASNTLLESVHAYRKLGVAVASASANVKAAVATLSVGRLDFSNESHLTAFIEGARLSSYRFERYKSAPKDDAKSPSLETIVFAGPKKIPEKIITKAEVFCEATEFARDLVNMPPNDCSPTHLMKTAKEVAAKGKLKFQLFDRDDLKKMGANSLLSVSLGSSEPPFLAKIVYKPKNSNSKTKVISLVGKGITFDSGGLSIKPASGMESMKIDMAGAAAVISVMKAVSVLKPSVEVRGYVPITENMISGKATRPGDIVKAMNGKTIEILNTDAEGRLILADALTLASRDKCNVIIDLATLTGAVVVALGDACAALYSDDDKLVRELLRSSDLAGEHLWRMPLFTPYRELIKGSVGDIKNSAGRGGGSITAALFLKEFVSDASWAHLDIAGTAETDKPKDHLTKGGVGFGVRTLLRYVLQA